LLLALPAALFAQIDTAWVRRYDGPAHAMDCAVAVATDPFGNVIVTGTSESTGTLRDYVTIKYSPTGQLLWRRRFYAGAVGASAEDLAAGLAVDATGNIYVTGSSKGWGTDWDYATVKYTPDGDQTWIARFDGPSHQADRATAITVDGTGHIYVTGIATSTGGAHDYCTIKYDPAGNTTEWIAWYPGPAGDSAIALAVDRAGNCYVTGVSSRPSSLNSVCATVKYDSFGVQQWAYRYDDANPLSAGWGNAVTIDRNGDCLVAAAYAGGDFANTDYLIIKFKPSGETLWTRKYCGTGGATDEPRAIAADNQNSVYVTGVSAVLSERNDFATLKYSSSGEFKWLRTYDGPSRQDDYATGLRLDPWGNVLVTGTSRGTSGVDDDYATLKYSSDGTQQWLTRYNGPASNNDRASAIALDGGGNAVVTGASQVLGSNYDYLTIKHANRDVGAIAIVSPPALIDSGTTIAPSCSVVNYGTTRENYPVRMRIGSFYDATTMVTGHVAGTKLRVTFPPYSAWPRGSHTAVCSTELGGDMSPVNDRVPTGRAVFVRVWDVGATAILAPAGTADSTTIITPSAGVRNHGNVEASFEIRFGVDDGYSDVIAKAVAPQAESLFTFAPWTAGPRGSHAVMCSTLLENDANRSNDRATGAVAVNVHDAAARAIVRPVGGIPPNAVIAPQARVWNCGTLRDPVDVTFLINSSPPYASTVNLTGGLPRTADTTIFFSDWLTSVGHYVARCSVYSAADLRRDNDTVSSPFAVGSQDGGITQIVRPVGNITPGVVVPAARVKNFGDLAMEVPMTFDLIRGGTVCYHDSQFVSALAPGMEIAVSFDSVYIDTGTFLTKANCRVYSDSHPQNDSMLAEIVSAWPPPGWTPMPNVPTGPRNKRVKDGGCLAYAERVQGFKSSGVREFNSETHQLLNSPNSGAGDAEGGYIYVLKGGNTVEFYAYNVAADTWAKRESIPSVGRAGRKKLVKKGGALGYDGPDHRIYALKGANTLEFWAYDCDSNRWQQKSDVPLGTGKGVKEGSGLAYVALGYVYLLKGSNTDELWRYAVAKDSWYPCARAPAGISGKLYKDGSCLIQGPGLLYALKGSYNEFYLYDPGKDSWYTKAPLPLVGSSGRKRKVKSGAGLTHDGRGLIYALKGNNSQEFWSYQLDSDRWMQLADLPLGAGKRVKGGGGLAAVGDNVYALKGNNTWEFWMYGRFGPAAAASGSGLAAVNQMGGEGDTTRSGVPIADCGLRIAPNPFSCATTISYSLPEPGKVSLKLYDVAGTLVRILASGYHAAGNSSFVVVPAGTAKREHRSSFARGVYVLKLETGDYRTTQKLILE
jgi:hypothetical protein